MVDILKYMNNLIKKKQELIKLLHSTSEDVNKPFVQEVLLLETTIARTTKIVNIKNLVANLKVGDKLQLYRDISNTDDECAIAIKNESNDTIGYLPRNDNVIIARLMEAGKLVYGKISKIEIRERWIRIRMKIFLYE